MCFCLMLCFTKISVVQVFWHTSKCTLTPKFHPFVEDILIWVLRLTWCHFKGLVPWSSDWKESSLWSYNPLQLLVFSLHLNLHFLMVTEKLIWYLLCCLLKVHLYARPLGLQFTKRTIINVQLLNTRWMFGPLIHFLDIYHTCALQSVLKLKFANPFWVPS